MYFHQRNYLHFYVKMQIGVIGFDTKSYCIMHYLCHVNIRLYKRIFRCLYYTEIEHGGVAVKCNTCIPKKSSFVSLLAYRKH